MRTTMEALTSVALLGWIPVSLAFFAVLDGRKAALAVYILGTLFLPIATIEMSGLPDFTKSTSMAIGALLGMLVFGQRELLGARLCRYDLPVLALCVSAGVSSLTNGVGVYDGLSAGVDQLVTWGVPYLVGRVYFRTTRDLLLFAVAIFLGGLIYMPLCLYEIRMSPQLHRIVYGYFQHSFLQAIRGDGYRPSVFMQHGLMVALWMSASAVVGIGLWRSRLVTRLWGLPTGLLAMALALVAVWCRSTGASVLMLLGLATIWESRALRTRSLLWGIVLLPSVYVALRLTGIFHGDGLVDFVGGFSPERAESLGFRFEMENRTLEIATQRPWFGWSQWRFGFPDAPGEMILDSLWSDAYVKFGIVGLALLMMTVGLPSVLMLRRPGRVDFGNQAGTPAGLLILCLGIFMVDSLVNAMLNPVFIMIAGAVTAVAVQSPAPARAVRTRVPRTSRARRPRDPLPGTASP